MASTRSWLPLPLPSSPDLPVLLISLDIGSASYTVRLTDMANIWTETLERKAICIRGWEENTTIDPSDTAENMSTFLTNLRAALDSSQPGHDKTRLELVPGSKAKDGEHSLILKITCDLPGLPPLKWPMILQKSPPSAVATDLVLPLVEAHLTRRREVESLIRTLEQKDAITAKLVDKLEALGTGLEHVFNPLSGKKKVSRATAEDKVPGLAPFNRRLWRSELGDEDSPNNAQILVQEVFGGEGLQYQSSMQIEESPGLDKWFHEFSGASHVPKPLETKTSLAREDSVKPLEKSFNGDDDFQVQSTPPHLKASRPSEKMKENSPSEDIPTEDEHTVSPLERGTSRRSATKDQGKEMKKAATKLGSLGRKKQPPPERSPSPIQIPSRGRVSSPNGGGSETASEAGDDGATASLPDDDPAHPASPPPKSSSRKGGLGRIGGPKPKPQVKEATDAADIDLAEVSTKTTTSSHKKLGVIGKKKKEDDSTNVKTSQELPRGRDQTARKQEHGASTAKPRETSKERADRKRAELKRDLEKKAAAGPAKKKRKF